MLQQTRPQFAPPNAAPMTPFVQIAPPESWTEEEQKRLEETLVQYPSSSYSIVSQCAKIAARLPNKTIRDVGASGGARAPVGRGAARPSAPRRCAPARADARPAEARRRLRRVLGQPRARRRRETLPEPRSPSDVSP